MPDRYQGCVQRYPLTRITAVRYVCSMFALPVRPFHFLCVHCNYEIAITTEACKPIYSSADAQEAKHAHRVHSVTHM